MGPEHLRSLATALRRQEGDLQFLSRDGERVVGHRSLACLASPLLAAILAEHEQPEAIITVSLPASSTAVIAFNRICEAGGRGSPRDTSAAKDLLRLLSSTQPSNNHVNDDAMEDVEDKVKLSPRWIKEDPVKMEEEYEMEMENDFDDNNDSDNEDDDYNPPSKPLTPKVENSPKKERSERVKCKRCPRTFAYMAALNKHMKKHREEDGDDSEDDESDGEEGGAASEYTFICDQGCLNESEKRGGRAMFKLEGSLIRHNMKIHQKAHECCGDSFSNYKSYRKHLMKSHHNYQCAECPATFYGKEKMDWHIKWVHETVAQKCSLCPAMIKDVDGHMKSCHTGELRTCTACPYTSRRKGDIDLHFKKVHTDESKETCPSCGDTFKGLAKHLERTKCGGKKPEASIPCPEGCPKMFTMQSSADKHVQYVHMQIKNKICPFCDYKTYSNFNLKLHVTKMHEGRKMEKQQCLYCDKTPYTLDHHMRIYHNDKL